MITRCWMRIVNVKVKVKVKVKVNVIVKVIVRPLPQASNFCFFLFFLFFSVMKKNASASEQS